MIKVKLHFMGPLADFTGEKEATIELPNGSKFRDLLKKIDERFGKKLPEMFYANGQYKMLLLMLNLRDIHPEKDVERPLADGDSLHVIPPVGGG